MVCDVAAGFWEEFSAANPEVEIPSGTVLRKMYRKRKTLHENQTSRILKQSGLSCPIPLDYVEIGAGNKHEIFRIESFLRLLALHNKLPLLLGHVDNLSLVEEYWQRIEAVDRDHPVFSRHQGREKFVVPCYLHADEGRTLKKSSIMICNLQPALGGNPDPEYDEAEMHTNMKYSSYCTRLLVFCMAKAVYKTSSKPFDLMLQSLAEELLNLWENGVQLVLGKRKITLYICVMAVKGDWPILAKLGKLERWFGRKTASASAAAKGVCHLCLGGKAEIPYHDYSADAAWRSTYLLHDPYLEEPPFAGLPGHDPIFYRFDPFHTCHKGILAELAGSGLVPSRIVQHKIIRILGIGYRG